MQPFHGAAITLDQLIALNEEIGALVRAGIPLEQGLSRLGEDMPGKLGKFATQIAAQLERGQSLSQAFQGHVGEIPRAYRAVVEAGARTGRLAAALEAVAASARRIADTRRMVAAAALYPLLVFLLAWVLFVVFVAEIVPRFIPFFEDFHAYGLDTLKSLAAMGDSMVYWGPLVPAVVVLLTGAWWYCTTRAGIAEPRLAAILLGWLPGIGRILRLQHAAAFAEVLALLVENRVPLGEGLVLAAEACGDPRVARSARAMAASLERGEGRGDAARLPGRPEDDRGLPPLVRWLIVAGPQRGALAMSLRHGAEMYRRRATHQAAVARTYLPILLTLAIGGVVAVVYVMLLMCPWIAMLRGLALP